jgi:hypothetical protein
MSGDLSVSMPACGTHHHNTDTTDFAHACATADRRQRANNNDRTISNASSTPTETSATMAPGVSVESATDTVKQGAQLVANAEPNESKLDQRIAWHEKWLAEATEFFSGEAVLSFLTPEQVAQAKADLASYAAQLKAFKELVAKYRAEGKEPSQEEVKDAFAGMREVRKDLKGLVGVVMDGVVDMSNSMALTAFETTALLDAMSVAASIMSTSAMQQSVLNDISLAVLEESRNSRYVYGQQIENSRLRAAREQTPESNRP